MRRLALVMLLLSGCVATPRPVPSQTDEIGLRFSGVILQFDRKADGDWNAIVQEVSGDGWSLVECFQIDKGEIVTDKHTWGATTQVRSMRVYLAVVEDVDWNYKGFAHLPENMDGSMKTTVGPWFNESYQAAHETRGRVVKMSRESLSWRIESDGHHLVADSP